MVDSAGEAGTNPDTLAATDAVGDQWMRGFSKAELDLSSTTSRTATTEWLEERLCAIEDVFLKPESSLGDPEASRSSVWASATRRGGL